MAEVPISPRPRPGGDVAVITGVAAFSAFGRGAPALLDAAIGGTPGFRPVDRFDVTERRVRVAATAPGDPVLADELIVAVRTACDNAGLDAARRERCDLLVALHGDPDLARAAPADRDQHSAITYAGRIASAAGVAGTVRAYTSACVAASTALADAAAAVAYGRAERVIVTAGYLVETDQYALFDAGRALATDGRVRPFSFGRTGILLGDGVGAVVVESAAAATRRGATVLARLAGWGRAGDAYHVVTPRPDGAGLATAIGVACERAGIAPDAVDYINAHGSGTTGSDTAEAAALARALGPTAGTVPISSTKSVHGQALEASAMLEFIVTVLAMRVGALPVNAGFREPDTTCPLNVVTAAAHASMAYAMSINSAFGGAHTALIVGAP